MPTHLEAPAAERTPRIPVAASSERGSVSRSAPARPIRFPSAAGHRPALRRIGGREATSEISQPQGGWYQSRDIVCPGGTTEPATIPPSLQDGITSGVRPGTSSLANFRCAAGADFGCARRKHPQTISTPQPFNQSQIYARNPHRPRRQSRQPSAHHRRCAQRSGF